LFLTLRQIQVRYKQTVLGIGWAVLRPFFTMVVFTIVFSKFAKIPSDGIPYPIFTYSALLPWTFFSSSLTSAVSSLINNASLIKQIYFPREIFLLSSILSALFDFALASIIFIGMMLFYGVSIKVTILFVFPLLALMILFTLALSFFLAAFNVYYRDIEALVSFGLQLLMYATPVIYSISAVPAKYRTLFMLNPLAFIIDSFRRVLVQGLLPDWVFFGVSVMITGVMFILSYIYFKKAEMQFADII